MLALPLSPFVRYNPKLPRRSVEPYDISVCENSEVKDGSVIRTNGFTQFTNIDLSEYTNDSAPRHITEHITNDGTRFICILTATQFFTYNTTTATITKYTKTGIDYTPSYKWSSCSYGNLFIFTNSIDPVQQWDGTDTNNATDLNAMSFRPKIVMTFGAHLIIASDQAAADTVELKAISWSVPGDPTDFSTAGSGAAYVYEGKGGIISAATMTRDTIGVYKSDSIHLFEYVGAPQYFVVRSSIPGIGIDGIDAVATVGNEHILLTNNGLRKFDGSTISKFGEEINPILSRYYPNNNSRYTSLVYDGYENKLWIFLPESGTAWKFTNALVYSFIERSWSHQTGIDSYAVGTANIAVDTEWRWMDMNIPWNHETANSTVWGVQNRSTKLRLIIGDDTSSVWWKDELSDTRFGASYISIIETMMYSPGFSLFQAPTWNTEVVQIDMGIVSGNPSVYVGTSNNGDESIVWRGPYTPDANGQVYITIVGRWFVFRIQSTGSFKVQAVTPWFVKRGPV